MGGEEKEGVKNNSNIFKVHTSILVSKNYFI